MVTQQARRQWKAAPKVHRALLGVHSALSHSGGERERGSQARLTQTEAGNSPNLLLQVPPLRCGGRKYLCGSAAHLVLGPGDGVHRNRSPL